MGDFGRGLTWRYCGVLVLRMPLSKPGLQLLQKSASAHPAQALSESLTQLLRRTNFGFPVQRIRSFPFRTLQPGTATHLLCRALMPRDYPVVHLSNRGSPSGLRAYEPIGRSKRAIAKEPNSIIQERVVNFLLVISWLPMLCDALPIDFGCRAVECS
jgi:hypothetical protein